MNKETERKCSEKDLVYNLDTYLSDEQYTEILKQIHVATLEVEEGKRTLYLYDCDVIGQKDTYTNLGMCNPEWVTKENSLWPEQFPQRKSRKYKQPHHLCPFDRRQSYTAAHWGCFSSCMLFHPKFTDKKRIHYVNQALKNAKFFKVCAYCTNITPYGNGRCEVCDNIHFMIQLHPDLVKKIYLAEKGDLNG